MFTIMIGKQKGGVAGTTVTREVAVAAAADGVRVVLVDLDPQGTLTSWWNRRTADAEEGHNPALAEADPAHLAAKLDELRPLFDLALLDAPPSVHSYFGEVMKLANLVLVPTGPTTDDLDALPPVLDTIEAANKPFAFVVTKAPTGRSSRLLDDAVALLAQRGRVCPPMRWRQDYQVAPATGGTGFEVRRSKATEEVAAIWEWVRKASKIKTRKRVSS